MRKPIHTHVFSLGLMAGTIFWSTHAVAGAKDYDRAVGLVAAAIEIDTKCDRIGPNGPSDTNGFIMAATDILADQGFGRQKMRAALFYAKTIWIDDMKATVLAERGVDVSNVKALCAFGKGVAGQNDTIGQFLVKE